MIIKPGFYDNFRCIADKCTDTCCAGWEIDVDDDTAEFYEGLIGENGEFVNSKLVRNEDGGLRLCNEGERCPFLRHDNLCEMIIRLGDGALCDICREHPRFYSETDNITEAGIGLCCEEAVRLWLCSDLEFNAEDDGYEPCDEEKNLLDEQMEIINCILHGDGTLGERLGELIFDGGEKIMDYSELKFLFSELEVMNADFPKRFSDTPITVNDGRFVNLAAYFIYRYYFVDTPIRVLKFTIASLVMIAAMDGELSDNIRLFSKEVEYDTDNVDLICDAAEYAGGLGALARGVLKCR